MGVIGVLVLVLALARVLAWVRARVLVAIRRRVEGVGVVAAVAAEAVGGLL